MSFHHCSDAFGAKHLPHQPAVFQNRHPLQIRVEGSVGCALGEASVMAKYGRFTTLFTLCHLKDPFLL